MTKTATAPKKISPVEFRPVTSDLWPQLEELFGKRGACGGCWCMAWRLRASEFQKHKGEKNRLALKALVRKGPPPGVLALRDGRAVGWCAVAPRSEYLRLETSRVLAPVDGQPVWSISCLFVAKEARRQGLSAKLVDAAAKYAKSRGARIVEGYPTASKNTLPDVFVWTGLPGSFEQAGFKEVARRSAPRPIFRRTFRAQ